MDTPATYLQWGFIQISVPNLLMILGMVALFVGAIVLPFPRHKPVSLPKSSAIILLRSTPLAIRWPWER